MKNNGFKEGKLTYTTAAEMTPEDLSTLLAGGWADGFVAFAASEKRLNDLEDVAFDPRFLSERAQGISGAEGYVTEINLWRKNAKVHEEVAAERQENTWYVQHWILSTDTVGDGATCWYRDAQTRTGSHHMGGKRLFSDRLATIEVVWPEKRLNFYITRG